VSERRDVSGQNYLFQYKAGIEKVTPDAVLEAAQRHLNPAKLITVIAADAEKVQPSLEGLGQTVRPLLVDD
jgi:zinc protease